LETERGVFDWLFEGHRVVYYSLGALALVLLILWKQVPRRSYLIATAVCLLLIGLYYLLDRLVVTIREEVKGTVQLMAASVAQRDLDQAFAHMSDTITMNRKPISNEALRSYAESMLRDGRVTEVLVWEFEFPEPVERDRPAKVTFQFKLRGDLYGKDDMYYRCDAVFRFEPPHGWVMHSCRILDPFHVEEEIPIPL